MIRLADLVLKRYKPTNWLDNLVEFPDRVKQIQAKDDEGNIIPDVYHQKKYEGKVYEDGTSVEERIMNNMEQGIFNNNQYVLAAIQNIKDLQLQVMILSASLTGNVNGDVYIDNLDNLDSINMNRGIYDEDEKCIYCVDSDSNRIELTGYAIAIG